MTRIARAANGRGTSAGNAGRLFARANAGKHKRRRVLTFALPCVRAREPPRRGGVPRASSVSLCLCGQIFRRVFVSFVPSWVRSPSPTLPALAFTPAGALLAAPLLGLRRRLAAPRPALAFADALEDLGQTEID